MTPTTTLFLLAAGIALILAVLMLTVALAWWVERTEPKRWEHLDDLMDRRARAGTPR